MSDLQKQYRVEAWDILQHIFKVNLINDHTLHFVAAFSSEIDLGRFKKAVAVSAEVFPFLGCRFNEQGRKPVWVSCADAIDKMVTLIETGQTDAAVRNFLCSEVDAFSGPQIKIGVIRDAGTDTIVILINHMLCDAAGFKDYLYLLSNIYNQIDKNPDFRPQKFQSRRIAQISKAFSCIRKIEILTSKNDMLTHDGTKFELEGDLNNPFIEVRNIPEETFIRLKQYAKKHNATINDMILTAYIRTLYQLFGHVITIPSTVDLRKYLPDRRAKGICNLCTNLSCNIGVEIGNTFADTLEKVKKSMDKEKDSMACIKSISLLEKLFDILPYQLAKSIVVKGFKNAPIAFTNIGIIDKERFCLENLQIKDAYMTGSIKYSPYFQLAISTYDNKPTLSVNLFGSQKDQNEISDSLDQILQELYGVISD